MPSVSLVCSPWPRASRHRDAFGYCYYRPMLRPIILALAAFISAPAVAAEPATAKVLSCYDGDTCRLEREILPGRDRVRLSNADTPEIARFRKEYLR
jgi:endonuclease YncB( thermonuclease family)